MVASFHCTSLPAPISHAPPNSTHQKSTEGDGFANLLEAKEIAPETVSQTQREH